MNYLPINSNIMHAVCCYSELHVKGQPGITPATVMLSHHSDLPSRSQVENKLQVAGNSSISTHATTGHLRSSGQPLV